MAETGCDTIFILALTTDVKRNECVIYSVLTDENTVYAKCLDTDPRRVKRVAKCYILIHIVGKIEC